MTIATQLKQLEEAFAVPDEASIGLGLSTEDNDTLKKVFSFAPAAFIDAWARALALSEDELTVADRELFARAIKGGTDRLRIVNALYSRKWARPLPLAGGTAHDICGAQDQMVLIENLEHFAPDDHAAFLRYAFRQICARDPAPTELLAFDFDLRRRVLERRSAIKKIVRIANQEGRPALWDSLNLEEDKSDPACARTLPTGFAYDENGREALIFVRAMSEGGWMVAPDILRQAPRMEQRGWVLSDGWVLTGPKRSLRPGTWRIDLDILQQDQILHVDVVANSGLDVLQELSICGPFAGSFCIDLASHHRFVELRLLARETAKPVWIDPRNISMHRVS
ncbi:hypothetical protein [Bradyrhizobium sp.]|uniref:hypothetical protein n=1 Tax=Bradyrhizobium sp. TaxID=376 RepID=UPI0039E38926